MASTKKISKLSSKKLFRQQVENTLEEVFADIKDNVGKKRFIKKIRKAGKILAAGSLARKKAAEKTASSAKLSKGNKTKLSKAAQKPNAKKAGKSIKTKKVKETPAVEAAGIE